MIDVRRFVLLVAATLISLPSQAAISTLPQELANKIGAQKIPLENVSIVIKAVEAQNALVTANETIPRNPASSIKLLTTFVALEVLGPTHTWTTRLYADGSIHDGVLDGDLVLKGGGDPFLVVEEFWKMLGELRSRGVHTINGDLVVDDSYFDVVEAQPGEFDQQPYRLYNVVPNAALVNFKAIEFQFSHAGDKKNVNVRMNPPLPNLRITNQLKAKPGKCRGYQYGISMSVPKPDIADEVVFSGEFPLSCRSHSMGRSALTPESYAFGTFQRLWSHWGGSLTGTHRSGKAPKRRALVVWRSRSLAELIRPLNKWSNNVMTRTLLYSLAGAKYKPPLSKSQGLEVMREYLQSEGLDDDKLVVDNGSGLSRKTRVTGRFMTDLLQHAYRSPYMPEFIASMSLVGLDGTTRRRFRGRVEAGRMHLKTGRLDKVAAVAGYVLAKSGKTYTVVVLVNHPRAHQGPGIEIQNAVLKWVYNQ